MTNPDVKTALHQLKWEASLFVRQADPDLRVHEETVMQINDAFLDARRPVVDLLSLLAPPPLQAMNSQKETILRLDDVFLSFVSP